MTLRPCLHHGCAKLTRTGSYCATHVAAHTYHRPNDERQSWAWRKARQQAIAEHPYCATWQDPRCTWAGDLNSLRLDHLVPHSQGGRLEHGVQVLCEGCNQRKGGVGRSKS